MSAGTVASIDPFDEKQYLADNPDVAAAVAAGSFQSGWAHYEAFGRREGRMLAIEEARRGRLLADIDLANGMGLEIGALDKPLVTKSQGKIFYVDYANAEYLRDRYRADPAVNIDRIVQVDGVWGQKTLAEIVGQGRHVDYVLASHVVEHVPDIVTWLCEIGAVLAVGGALRLAVPDRRYTFDYTRRESTLADALDAYIRKARAPLPRQILDFCHNARRVDVVAAWQGPLDVASCRRDFSDESALALATDAFQNGTYHDVHCWVFTPATFVDLMAGLVKSGLVDMRCEFVTDTRCGQLEFMVSMRAEADRATALASWENVIFI